MFAIPTVAWDQEVTKESLQAQILEQRRASGSGRARNMDVDMSEAKVLMAQAAACFAAEFSPAAANVTDLHNASKSVDCSAYNAAAKDHVYKDKIAFKTHTAQKRKPSHHWRAASRVSELMPRDLVSNVTLSDIGLTAANTSNVSVVQGSNKTVPYGFLNSSGASGYISPASLGEKGFAAFHLFIMEHDNFSVSAAHATKIAGRKSNHLQLNGSTDEGLLNPESTPPVNATQQTGPLMINMSDGSRWFLPVLKPLRSIPLGTFGMRGFASPHPKHAGAGAAEAAGAGAAEAADGFKVVGGFRFKSDTSTSNPDEPLRSKDVAGNAIRGLIEGGRVEEQGQKEADGSYGPNLGWFPLSSKPPNLGHVHANLKVREAKDLGIGSVDDDDIWILDREYDKRHKK